MGATVVSICPFPIHEYKPGLKPNIFKLPAVRDGEIEVLHVSDEVTYRQRIPVIGTVINIPVRAEILAASIVNDRVGGQLLYSEVSKPGLFWVPGILSAAEVKAKHGKELIEARSYQREWFLRLVKMADDDWNKYHQHKFISDLQRHAAKVLGVTKEWTTTITDVAGKTCVACFAPMHPQATICQTCRTNQEEFLAARKEKK